MQFVSLENMWSFVTDPLERGSLFIFEDRVLYTYVTSLCADISYSVTGCFTPPQTVQHIDSSSYSLCHFLRTGGMEWGTASKQTLPTVLRHVSTLVQCKYSLASLPE